MKSWKAWSYWSRGATIAVVICLLFIFFQTVITPHFFYNVCGESFCISGFAVGVRTVFNYITLPLLYSMAGSFFLENPAVFFLSALVYCFFVGAFIGLLYGKVRYGKGTIHPPQAQINVTGV